MKRFKLLLLIAFLGMVSLLNAQTSSFNIKGGLNMSSIYGDDLNDAKMKLGFHIGVGADFGFTPNLFLQTGLFYTVKGSKTVTDAPISVTGDANYLQLPVHLAYKMDVTPGTKIVFHAGPYVAYGIGGKIKFGDQEINTFNKDTGVFKTFDAGAGIGIGAEFGKILVDLGWDMGLINIAQEGEGSGNVKNKNAYISLGYKF